MELAVERDVLADAVTWAARSVPARPPVPVLAGVLVEADAAGVLRLSSFDYEVSARVEVPADVAMPGSVLVSGRLLADIARSLPARPVNVTTEGTKVWVRCGSSRFALLTMPVDDYPALPPMPASSGTLAGDAFSTAVSQVVVAASRDETLPVLTGVRMEIAGDTLTLMATDRYRLAVREMPWQRDPSSQHGGPDGSGGPSAGDTVVALVRGRTLSEVARAIGGGGDVTLSLSSTGGSELIGFQAGGRRTTSLLVDGEYPKVRSLFPAEAPVRAVVETSALAEAVRRVALVAERNTPVRLAFDGEALVLEAGTGDDAQASEVVPATLDGDPITIAFNPGYLLDGIGAVGTPYVRLSFTQATKPAVLTGQAEETGDHDPAYRYLLMPVRVPG